MPDDLHPKLLRWISSLKESVKLMIRRCRLGTVTDENKTQVFEIEIFKGETRSGVERIQEFGFSSVPPEGGQAIVVFLGGEGSHPAIVATDDRRYRPREKDPGDVTIYTDRDVDEEHHIYLGSKDRYIRVRGNEIFIKSDALTRVECENAEVDAKRLITLKAGDKTIVDSDLHCTGSIKAAKDITDKGISMARMRSVYDGHVHPENDNGGPTSSPTSKMGA